MPKIILNGEEDSTLLIFFCFSYLLVISVGWVFLSEKSEAKVTSSVGQLSRKQILSYPKLTAPFDCLVVLLMTRILLVLIVSFFKVLFFPVVARSDTVWFFTPLLALYILFPASSTFSTRIVSQTIFVSKHLLFGSLIVCR